MILLKLKNCNTKHTEIYKMLKLYNEGNNNYIISCPHCNSNNLISHGYYKRTVIFEYNNEIISYEIKINRVKCKGCGHTHALLPFVIIPYKQVVLSVIINCLYDESYFNSSPFSYDVRLKWFKQY